MPIKKEDLGSEVKLQSPKFMKSYFLYHKKQYTTQKNIVLALIGAGQYFGNLESTIRVICKHDIELFCISKRGLVECCARKENLAVFETMFVKR